MNAYRIWGTLQSVYILITALWPLVDIETFMAVTGPKTDVWLVKTVSALLLPCGLTIFFLSRNLQHIKFTFLLGGGTALSLCIVDVVYAARDVISNVYMLDAAAELILVSGWAVIFAKRLNRQ